MDVKVVWKSGDIVAHAIPQYAGKSSSIVVEQIAGEESYSDIDEIADIVESFVYRDGVGYLLSREIVRRSGKIKTRKTANGTEDYCIVSEAELDDVARIDVDGEQVYPPYIDDPLLRDIDELVGSL